MNKQLNQIWDYILDNKIPIVGFNNASQLQEIMSLLKVAQGISWGISDFTVRLRWTFNFLSMREA